tara:strand:- start:308 stop:409 length:102 start_codon:yes stop_codon:yes gene_type:complete
MSTPIPGPDDTIGTEQDPNAIDEPIATTEEDAD